MVYKALILLLFFIFANFHTGLSQPTVGEIEKTRRDLEIEKALRLEIEKGEKTYIKKIIVKGITLLTKDEIKKIVQPFKNHWLSTSDVNLILDSLFFAYKQKGYPEQPANIFFKIKKGYLEIKVEEARPRSG